MKNNMNSTRLLELENPEVVRDKERLEEYLRTHGYEILHYEVSELPKFGMRELYIKMVVAKDGKQKLIRHIVR